jgi:hypothetical protein
MAAAWEESSSSSAKNQTSVAQAQRLPRHRKNSSSVVHLLYLSRSIASCSLLRPVLSNGLYRAVEFAWSQFEQVNEASFDSRTECTVQACQMTDTLRCCSYVCL